MNHTQNYQLSQWVKSDKVQMEDFNADNAAIDAALGTHAAALAALETSKGNCRVETQSYTGQSTQDKDGSRNSLSFSGQPAFVLIFGGNSILLASGASDIGMYAGTYDSMVGERTVIPTRYVWEENALVLIDSRRQVRMDAYNTAYQVVAWIPMVGE